MTLYADKCVGRIIDALEENGLREKTVIIYTTDNGTHRALTYPYGSEERKGEKAYATDGGNPCASDHQLPRHSPCRHS